MPQVPGLQSVTQSRRRVRWNARGSDADRSIILDSGNTDTGSTPATRFREGNVVVYKTSITQFVEANDSTGDRNTQATVTAAETADSDWRGATITCKYKGVQITVVTLATTDDTDAEVVTALNADADFAAWFVASTVASRVTIKSLEAGADVHIEVTSSLSTAFGASGTTAFGTDADYAITLADTDLVDSDGTAVDATVRAAVTGDFDESNLVNLTAEARATLSRRGAIWR